MKIRRDLRRRLSDDSGAEVVEFAVVVPILFLIICAFIYFGFMLMTQITLNQAAREGARTWAICSSGGGSCSSNTTSVVTNHAPGLDSSKITVTPGTACPADPASTDVATVTVTYPFKIGIPPFVTTTWTLTGKSSTPCGG
jgi:Flp pilus assembly protein TadG